MKRLVFALVLILIAGSMVFAQAKKTAPASASAAQGFTAVSLNQLPFAVGAPSARFGFGGWSLDLGGSLANVAAGTTITAFGRGEITISNIESDIRTYWAPALAITLPPAGNSTTTLSVYLGAEYMFASHLALFADLTAFTLTSVGGATTWTVGDNSFWIYTGGRLYL